MINDNKLITKKVYKENYCKSALNVIVRQRALGRMSYFSFYIIERLRVPPGVTKEYHASDATNM